MKAQAKTGGIESFGPLIYNPPALSWSDIAHRSLTIAHPALIALMLAAAAVYCLDLGRTLGASEAYSALAALQPTVQSVTQTALSLDPGKPVLYHLALHWFSGLFGSSEMSLRVMSVLFALGALVSIYLLTDELFGPAVALSAALIWAFNPLAVLFAQWARMYSMFIAVALAHLLFMAKLRRLPDETYTMLAGLFGAVMLYTHLGGVLILAAECTMIARDFWVRGRSNTWPAVAIAAALFAPFIPTAVSQGGSLLFGHWLDWIGQPQGNSSFAIKAILAMPMAVAGLWLVFAQQADDERSESLRWCAALGLVPIMIMVGACVLIRPMFQIRYLAPCWALAAVVLAYALDSLGTRFRRLGVVAITGLFLAFIPMYNGVQNPWRDIARQIESNSNSAELVVFEAGFFTADGTIGGPATGFPDGYYRVPFDFYFRAPNPRAAVPASDPVRARKLITAQLEKTGGVWLVSGKKRPDALKEVPGAPYADLVSEIKYSDVLVLHLKRATNLASRTQFGT